MRLQMVLGDIVVDSIRVEPYRCKQPGYLDAMKRCLQLKHFETITEAKLVPHFYLEVKSRMNEENFRED